jgi:hypothetical protein
MRGTFDRRPAQSRLCRFWTMKAWQHSTESNTARGYGAQWRKLRTLVMQRDAGICQPCKKLGIQVVLKEGYAATAPDLSSLVTKMRRAKPDVVVMHPGPINRGIEITSDVADHAQSLILQQVENGVAVRMAVLYLLAGSIK